MIMEDVRKHVDPELVKEAWAIRSTSLVHPMVEFQIPTVKFHWHGQGCCVWYAKAQGWAAYMAFRGIKGYAVLADGTVEAGVPSEA